MCRVYPMRKLRILTTNMFEGISASPFSIDSPVWNAYAYDARCMTNENQKFVTQPTLERKQLDVILKDWTCMPFSLWFQAGTTDSEKMSWCCDKRGSSHCRRWWLLMQILSPAYKWYWITFQTCLTDLWTGLCLICQAQQEASLTFVTRVINLWNSSYRGRAFRDKCGLYQNSVLD